MSSSTSTQTSIPIDHSAPRSESESRKAWAGGLTVFAGVILIIVGVFQSFQGLAAIVKGSYYPICTLVLIALHVAVIWALATYQPQR